MTETAERNATHAAVKSGIAKPRLIEQVRDRIYPHVINRGGRGVISPLDRI